MSTRRETIGFDRKIDLPWLEATAKWASDGLPVPEIRSRLEALLEGRVAGDGSHSARGKTITVLMRIWVLVPDQLVALRDEALTLLATRSERERICLHWGMCLANYPFFHDVVTVVGRLLRLQDRATVPQVTRRMSETWGERSTVIRSTQRVVRSLILWGIVREHNRRGLISSAPPISLTTEDDLVGWLLEACVTSDGERSHPFRGLVSSAALFPFSLHAGPRSLRSRDRLVVHRQGLDDDVVLLKTRP